MNNELSLFIPTIHSHGSQQHLFVIPIDLSAEASAKAEAKTGLAVAGTATFYLMR